MKKLLILLLVLLLPNLGLTAVTLYKGEGQRSLIFRSISAPNNKGFGYNMDGCSKFANIYVTCDNYSNITLTYRNPDGITVSSMNILPGTVYPNPGFEYLDFSFKNTSGTTVNMNGSIRVYGMTDLYVDPTTGAKRIAGYSVVNNTLSTQEVAPVWTQSLSISNNALTAPGGTPTVNTTFYNKHDYVFNVTAINTSCEVQIYGSYDGVNSFPVSNKQLIATNGVYEVQVNGAYKYMLAQFLTETGGTAVVIQIQEFHKY